MSTEVNTSAQSIKPLVVINVVGLTPAMLGENTPCLLALARQGFARRLGGILPGVTCSAQATMLTGSLPREHGIVANGWYFRDLAEILFWRQSNHLVRGEKLWHAAKMRMPEYTTAKMFWWYNMYADVEWSVTPRPSYPADGRKVFDSYSSPAGLKDELQQELGTFPLLRFWGPGADISSSRWIVDASIRVLEDHRPNLLLAYLPHLDYNLQRLGPQDPAIAEDVRAIDAEAGRLIDAANTNGAEVVVVSEYAITAANKPVHINRVLRQSGDLVVRREALGWETLDAGASRAFAVSDHQLAHIYIKHAEDLARVKSLLSATDGIDLVLDRQEQQEFGLDHQRSGELVAVAAPGAWFTYYFWLDDAIAPDYARTVDIHRKPGYDPAELFIDPNIRLPKIRIARRLLRKKLGFRYYMDLTPLDATFVKGTHGRLPSADKLDEESPILISSSKAIERDEIAMTDVKSLLLELQFGSSEN